MLAIIEVLIGLAFIYGLFSVLVSAATELLLAIWSQRGRILWGSVQTLLPGMSGKTETAAKRLGDDAGLVAGEEGSEDVCQEFLKHPLITGLGAKTSRGGKVTFPSYMPPHVFVDALLHMLRSGSIRSGKADIYGEMRDLIDDVSNPKLRRTLQALYMSALDSGLPFRVRLEQWFNDAMDRASGTYKRSAHIVMFLTAFVLAGACNVDTLKIIAVLSTNTEMRQSIAKTAQDYLKEMQQTAIGQLKEGLKEVKDEKSAVRVQALPPPSGVAPGGNTMVPADVVPEVVLEPAEPQISAEAQVIEEKVGEFSTALSQMNDFGLPIGWTAKGGAYAAIFAPLAILGWLLSALAATLGANFWFHVLGNLVKFRLTGRKPEPASAVGRAAPTAQPVPQPGMIPAGPGYAPLTMESIVPEPGHGLDDEPRYVDQDPEERR
jgi:hypothetical protein